MFLEWEDGYKQKIQVNQILCGITRNGKRPTKLYYSKHELETQNRFFLKKMSTKISFYFYSYSSSCRNGDFG